ncbi:MAG: NAD(P)H-dependent oxidoreductase subunit E [Sulfolobales archaeon]
MASVKEKNVDEVLSTILSKYNQRHHLMRLLQEVQSNYGYLPREVLEKVAQRTGIPLSDIINVATFYHQYRLEVPGYYIFLVCMGTACHLKGNQDNYNVLRSTLGIEKGSTSSDGLVSVEKARCFGCCSLAPVIMVVSRDGYERYLHGNVNIKEAKKLALTYKSLAAKKVRSGE